MRCFITQQRDDTSVQGLESAVGLLTLILQLLLFFMLQLAVMWGITGGIGVAGGVLSAPMLSVLPDVRRFLILASGGHPDDETPSWRVVLRPRYLLLSMVFGILYGLVVVVLLVPFIRFGLFPGRGELTLSLALLPAVYVVASTLFAYGVHRFSSAWTETTSTRSVLIQWAVFLGVVVTVGTGSAYVAALV